MSRIYSSTRQGKAEMFKNNLRTAERCGDWGMARNCRVELAALGIFETTEADTALEYVVPERPRRGRKPKPRCEHGMIAERCPDCNEDLVA